MPPFPLLACFSAQQPMTARTTLTRLVPWKQVTVWAGISQRPVHSKQPTQLLCSLEKDDNQDCRHRVGWALPTTRTAVIWWVGRSPQPYPLAHLSRSLEADECQDCHHPDSGTPHNPAPWLTCLAARLSSLVIIQRFRHSPQPCPLAHLSHNLSGQPSSRDSGTPHHPAPWLTCLTA